MQRQSNSLALSWRGLFWRGVFWLIMAAGIWSTWVRFSQGLGASTNLSDRFPWGIWVGFNVLSGVGLAAGGFTIAGAVHIFHLERYRAIVRPATLTAFLGYLAVVSALVFELGKPWNIWHPLIMWNPHSVMFEVCWCVTLYLTVLFLEFLPIASDRMGWTRLRGWLRKIMVPVVILGVILSTLHQSSLGSMYLIMEGKLHPLWYSPLLPVLFYLSSIAVGLAMTIFESWHSAKAFGRNLPWPLVEGLSRALAVAGAVYLALRIVDLKTRHIAPWQFGWTTETLLFTVEAVLLSVPVLLLFADWTRRSPQRVYVCASAFLLGFVANRMNVAVTGMERSSGVTYTPHWMEWSSTLMLIAGGFAVFRLAVRYLPVYGEPGAPAAEGVQPSEAADWRRRADSRVAGLAHGD